MIRILRVALVLLLAFALAGCLVRLAYSQADWLIAREVNQYVTLTDAQSDFFDERIDAQLQWHCRDEVPRYQTWFASLEAHAEKETLSHEDLEARADDVESFVRTLAERIEPDATALLASLSDEQVEELLDNLQEQRAELREEFAEPDTETRRTERADRMEDRLRRFYGRLNAEQQARLQEWAGDLAVDPEQWLESRKRWHEAFRDALERRNDDAEAFETDMRRLLTDWQAFWSDEYRRDVERSREQALELLLDVHESASQRQRERAARRLGSWEGDMARMACE